jgi:biotin transport system substrate-specific component
MAETFFKHASFLESTVPRLGWRTPVAVFAAAGLVALCAHIGLPLGYTPVPVTMQTFGVLLVGLLLSPGAAFASLALYLAEGAVGLPVFSPHGPGGIAQLLGPTGGYLLAYPFAAAIASKLYRYARRGAFAAVVGASLGSVLILLAGATWLGIVTHAPASVVFAESVAPFLVGDIFKIAAAAVCAAIFDSFRKTPSV